MLPQPAPTTVSPVVKASSALQTADGIVTAAGGSILSPGMASQGAMAMAVVRVGKCIGKNSDDSTEEDEASDDNEIRLGAPLPMFVHPLAFPLGTDPFRYLYGAVLGNIVLIPLALFIVLHWPVAMFLQRWGLPETPPLNTVREFLGLPYVLILPYAALAESMAVVASILLAGSGNDQGIGKALPSMTGVFSAVVLFGIALLWLFAIVFRLMPIKPIRERSTYEGILWWLFKPWYEWVPPKPTMVAATLGEDEPSDQSKDFEILDTWGLLLGDKILLWADFICYLLAVVAGVIEGVGEESFGMNCEVTVIVMFVLAVSQALLAITTMVPAEFIVHALMAIAVTMLSTAALIEAIKNDPDAVLSEDQQYTIGLVCNALAFFGTAVGIVRALVRIFAIHLKAKAQYLLMMLNRRRLRGEIGCDSLEQEMLNVGDDMPAPIAPKKSRHDRILRLQSPSSGKPADLLDLFLSAIKEDVEEAQQRRESSSVFEVHSSRFDLFE